jgi:hypothetical protein
MLVRFVHKNSTINGQRCHGVKFGGYWCRKLLAAIGKAKISKVTPLSLLILTLISPPRIKLDSGVQYELSNTAVTYLMRVPSDSGVTSQK